MGWKTTVTPRDREKTKQYSDLRGGRRPSATADPARAPLEVLRLTRTSSAGAARLLLSSSLGRGLAVIGHPIVLERKASAGYRSVTIGSPRARGRPLRSLISVSTRLSPRGRKWRRRPPRRWSRDNARLIEGDRQDKQPEVMQSAELQRPALHTASSSPIQEMARSRRAASSTNTVLEPPRAPHLFCRRPFQGTPASSRLKPPDSRPFAGLAECSSGPPA